MIKMNKNKQSKININKNGKGQPRLCNDTHKFVMQTPLVITPAVTVAKTS